MMKKILFIIISIMLLIGITTTANNNNVITPKVEKGKLDLSQWNFQEQGNLELDGQWQFYWDKLLDYKTVKTDNTGTYEEVPNVWSQYMVNGNKIPGKGYATYKLHVNSKITAGAIMGFRISNFSSAYNLYINETLVASNGKVGKNISEEIGEYRPEASVFMVPAKEFDIIIQVSNFHYARGGFWSSISLGDYEKILKLNDSIYGKEYFVLGALLVVIVFYLIIFFLDREVKYNLYFTLLCMMLAILMDVEGQFLLLALFPNLSINTIIFILYSSSTWVIYLLILYLDELFNSEFSSIVLKLFLVISIFDEITYIILPTTTYTEYGLIHNYIEIVGVFCALIIVIIGLKKKKKYVGLNIFSMVIVLVTYIHDILFMTNKIKSSFGELLYLGLFTFIFIHMIIQAKLAKEYYDNKISAELGFLQAQIKPHFLYNALNTVIEISKTDIDKSRELLIDFSYYLRGSFDFKESSQFVDLEKEIESAKAYLEIEKARFKEPIEVIFDITEDVQLKVPRIILQPIIENAIIHGILPKNQGGKIQVSIIREKEILVFSVTDNGVGMNENKLSQVFNDMDKDGIGIANIEKRLKKLYGKGLEIKSKPKLGTQIQWEIPLKRQRNKDDK